MAHTVSSILGDRTLNRIMAIESRGKLRAKAPTSSALGLFQFLNGTWLETVRKHRPDLLHGRSTQQVLALRTDGTVCIELGARFTEDNARGLGAVSYVDGDLYLAHFLGLGSARKVLRSNQDTSAVAVCGTAAANANPTIFYKKGADGQRHAVTCAQLRAWAQKSMVTRWEQAGSVDYVAQFYNAASPLADAHHAAPKDHEELDNDAPVKTEEPDDEQNDTETEVEDTPRTPREAPAADDRDDEPTIVQRVKSAIKSKIAWVLGGLGGTGVSTSATNDPDLMDMLGRIVLKPSFWIAVACIVAAAIGIYFYWRDHGKGALR